MRTEVHRSHIGQLPCKPPFLKIGSTGGFHIRERERAHSLYLNNRYWNAILIVVAVAMKKTAVLNDQQIVETGQFRFPSADFKCFLS